MKRQHGVTYLALLLAIALVCAVLAASATVWSEAQRREREKQLLWAGEQLRRAIAAYARFGNGTYPRRLEDLLEDVRTPVKRRHLRQIYEDPMTRSTDWGLIRNAQGQIVGVHSRHDGKPIRTGRFPAEYLGFEKARTYADWKFAAVKLVMKEDLEPAAAPAQPPAASAEDKSARPAAAPPSTYKPLAIPRSAVIGDPPPAEPRK